jgi:VanZ family protein
VDKKYFAWAAVVIYSVLIFVGSSIPGDRIELGIPGIDKLIHTVEYLILSILLFTSLKLGKTIGTKAVFWITVAGSSLYGFSDEIHQLFVPLRQFDVLDIASDVSGSILGAYLMLRISNNARTCPFKP